ncbi:UNVERIFIED_CONTAM: VCBS repeat-containing protein, partial [Salmonella enterica subsp. enterica serovar Weltevreden]
GVLDIAVFEDQVTSLSIKILQYNGSSLSVYYSGSIPFSGNITAKLLRLIGVGDYNGDGKADLAFMSHNKSSLSVCYSTGSTLTAPKSI